MIKRSLICALAFFAGAHISYAQQSMAFTTYKDNTIYEDANGELSNGLGNGLIAGKTGQGAIRRALIAYDLSTLPTGAIIEKVTLELTLTKGKAEVANLKLHKVTTDWGEGESNADGAAGQGAQATTGDATWIHGKYNTDNWTNAGGDYEAIESAATDVIDETIKYSWATAQMVADVEGWIANPATNFGWMIIGDESKNGTTRHFSSKEHATETNRPVITVLYTMPNSINITSSDVLSIYPNPFSNKLTINITDNKGDINVRILNSAMKEVYYAKINSDDALDVSALKPGIYFAVVTTSKGIITRKIIKTK